LYIGLCKQGGADAAVWCGASYVLIDTPGQIEVFTWSASGTIITEALAASYPTVALYVIDTPRSTGPPTFMSNMLYACRYARIAPPTHTYTCTPPTYTHTH
jgi:hypothetical protein